MVRHNDSWVIAYQTRKTVRMDGFTSATSVEDLEATQADKNSVSQQNLEKEHSMGQNFVAICHSSSLILIAHS